MPKFNTNSGEVKEVNSFSTTNRSSGAKKLQRKDVGTLRKGQANGSMPKTNRSGAKI